MGHAELARHHEYSPSSIQHSTRKCTISCTLRDGSGTGRLGICTASLGGCLQPVAVPSLHHTILADSSQCIWAAVASKTAALWAAALGPCDGPQPPAHQHKMQPHGHHNGTSLHALPSRGVAALLSCHSGSIQPSPAVVLAVQMPRGCPASLHMWHAAGSLPAAPPAALRRQLRHRRCRRRPALVAACASTAAAAAPRHPALQCVQQYGQP